MWICLFVLALTVTSPTYAQRQSRCVTVFDGGFRQCFRSIVGFELDIVFSLVTNETSGRLPPNLAPQKPNLIKNLCGNRQGITNCITPLVTNADPSCSQQDIGMMDGTTNSMVSGVANLCGVAPPQGGSNCLQAFDVGFRKCLTSLQLDPDNFFKLLANQTLPSNVNRNQLKASVCDNQMKARMVTCASGLIAELQPKCEAKDTVLVSTTLQNMLGAREGLCTGKSINPDQCMRVFEDGMNKCAQKTMGMDMTMILMTLNNKTSGKDQTAVQKQICGRWRNLENCGKNVIGGISCGRLELLAVEASFANIMITTATYCGDTCFKMALCSTDETLTGYQIYKKRIYPFLSILQHKWKELEICGKNAVMANKCPRNQLLPMEANFANLVITMATFCGDDSLPGACLLTLQKQFGECFGKVGLAPEIYLSNATDHKGALIGANHEEAKVYCEKKHDLFTCMQEVIHRCPGAEQTLSLTGFDLHGMERAVGLLCHDVDDYLAGLKCFAEPTDAAKQCMQDMTLAITDLSTKQITQQQSMDVFFADFCTARVKHVACDAAAWPTCNQDAVALKNQFECQLIPSRCYNSHKDNIDVVCPHTDVYIPDGDANIKVHEQPDCARNIRSSMSNCFQQYGVNSDLFLVNITDDRRNILGDANKAKSLCMARNSIFQCMRSALNNCPAAKDVLSYWGHQQSSLENAVNLVCQELPIYTKGYQCFANGNNQVQRCISNTESKMMNLADKQVSKNLSPDSYFRDFCSIRIEHLRCDLNGWKQSCDDDVIGLKTEFECRLIQEHCRNLQVGNFKNICNEQTYAMTARQNGGMTGSQNDNGVAYTSGSMFAVIGGVALSFVLSLL